MKGVILHGGAGTRLRPLTHTGPKQLIKIANKPMSQYALESLVEAGITDIYVILGEIFPEKVQEYYRDGSKFNCNITYITQGKPLGIAHAIGLTEMYIKNDKFVVILGDNLLSKSIKTFTKKFEKSDADIFLLFTKSDHPQDFGVGRFSKTGELLELVEKPKVPPSNYVITGIYYFTPQIFTYIKKLKPSFRGELEITEAIQHMLKDHKKVEYEFVEGWWKDTGSPEDILIANQLILDRIGTYVLQNTQERHIEGRVSIGKNVIIEKNVTIRGPVIIGNNVKIGSNTYIGPYTSIGDNVYLKGVEIENSIILENCVINTNTKIIDSIIGTGTEIKGSINKPKGHRMVLGENTKILIGE